MFSSCEALLLIERTRKNAEMAPFNSNGAGEGSRTEGPTPEKKYSNWSKYGAGEGSRNPISSLENLHTNRCTTPAAYGVGYRDRTDDLLDHNQTL